MTPWVAVTLGIIAVAVLISLLGAVAVRFFNESMRLASTFADAHRQTLETLERIHSRNMLALSEMSDRFMAMDFSTFKAYQLAGEADVGGFEEPEEQGRIERPLRDGRFAVVGSSDEAELAARANEMKLLAEDFPDEA